MLIADWGEMIAEQKATVGLAKGTRPKGKDAFGAADVEAPKDTIPTLAGCHA